MNDALQPITFHQDTIFIVDNDGEPMVPVKPIAENIGLNWSGQFTKLSDEKERWNCLDIQTVAADGKQREMLCIPLRKINGWLMTISPSKVSPEIKDTLIAYQNECDEVLWNYWTEGTVLNHRLHPHGNIPVGMTLVDENYFESLLLTNKLQEKNSRLLEKLLEHAENQTPKRVNFSPEEDARVLELRKQGLSLREIGDEVGRCKSSIRSCLRRLGRDRS